MIKILGKATVGLMLILASVCCFNIPAMAQPGASVSIQTFYDELEPYGQWIDDPEFGYVWLPDAGPDFKPYATNGHWVATEYGNTWVSDYDWGWAPFHYGRWRFVDAYGWEWIPGTEWGPAWVNWRTGDDYYGWAPLGPGIDIDISFGSGYYAPDNYWVFAPRRYIYASNVYNYYVPFGRNVNIIRNTTIINNIYSNNNRRYISGPRPDDVRRYTNAPVNIYNLGNRNRPGTARIRNNTLNIYRPAIAASRNDNNRPTPNRVFSRGNIDAGRNGFNNNNPGRTNRNPTFNNPRQPASQGNSTLPGSNPGITNNGFGRSRGNSNNTLNGNQFPQRSGTSQNSNNNTNNNVNIPSANGTAVNGANPSTPASRPTRGNWPNQPAQNTNGQQGTDWRQSRSVDLNRNRTPADNQQIQQNQAQQQQWQQRRQEMQQRGQEQMQQNQANQQREQEMRQRSQQQQTEQSQRNQQQMQQRQQEMQQRSQPQNQQRPQQQERQQRPTRQEMPQRYNNRS